MVPVPTPAPSLQPQRETDTNQITSQIEIKLQLVHEGEVDVAVRTCNLRFPPEAEVWPAQCGRSRCIEGTWENISLERRAPTKVRPERWAELDHARPVSHAGFQWWEEWGLLEDFRQGEARIRFVLLKSLLRLWRDN